MELVNIKSEITGNVWKLLVSEGDRVSEGDELLVVESMKMEIPVISPSDGVIKEVKIQEGDPLPEGQIALTIMK